METEVSSSGDFVREWIQSTSSVLQDMAGVWTPAQIRELEADVELGEVALAKLEHDEERELTHIADLSPERIPWLLGQIQNSVGLYRQEAAAAERVGSPAAVHFRKWADEYAKLHDFIALLTPTVGEAG